MVENGEPKSDFKGGTKTCKDGKIRGIRLPSPETNCLTPGCKRKCGGEQEKKGARGLCWVCHQSYSNLIKNHKTTWEELEELGLANPPYKTLAEKALGEARKKNRKQGNNNADLTEAHTTL